MVLNEEQWIKEIREKRVAYGISQGRLAVASGITREYLNKIESGKMKPSKELLETLHKELARFNPEAPLTMLFDYVKIRFPTLDIQHIIKDILKLNINYMLHEDYGHYSYTEHYSLGDIFIYTSADEEKGVLLELKGRGCRQFESYLLAQQRSWYDFLMDALIDGGVMKRIDLAINDHTGILDIPELAEKCRKREYIGKSRSYKFYQSGELIKHREDDREYMGRAVAGSSVAGKRAERKNTASKENRGNTTSSMGQRAGSKVGAVLDTKNKVKDKANAVKENIKDMPTQTAYAVYSAKEKAKSSVSDFKRGMVQEQQSRQTGRLEKQEQHRQNIADKRMELQKAQEARQAQRKADGSATTGATRPHERPATASSVSKTGAEKMQEVKRPATATTSKISEPVKANVIKERPLSSGASDRKATQPAQPVHRQNVEKVVSQETRQNDTKDRRTKVQQTQTVQKNQQTKEKNRSLVTKKGQKKK
ncbi:Helix-turn-helix [Blautia obeum]|uniref:Helix-turn-helix n=4 Tax=Lachnospiraceae TaxID=186803 RepID=A0A174SRH2_9FIRM|nr:Helix-turn-helix [Blautia obeum]